MSTAEDREGSGRPAPTGIDAAFEPEPVAPEEARRREGAGASPSPRAIVELTSPIGHRLRVPQPAAESDPPSPETERKPHG